MISKIYPQQKKKTEIFYTIISCDLGYLLVANTDKGICKLKLGDRAKPLVKILAEECNQATIIRDNKSSQNWIEKIENFLVGKEYDLDLPLDICGTEFQRQVWQALQNIPYGATRTYQEIANDLGKPKATRAIGNACGANPIALIIPCHRVVCSDGSLGGYHWGIERKQKLLDREKLFLLHKSK